ncbi:MAG: CIA30 family protein [Lacunisphaera sp.]
MNPSLRSTRSLTIALIMLATSIPAVRAADPALVDDFSNATQTAHGAARLLITDKDAGSKSTATQRCENGVLVVEGNLVPGRGAPAFISIPLLLSPDAHPQDISAFTGVRLRVKLGPGNLSVQVAIADITNFDYHSMPVIGQRGEFVEVRLPFKEFKRAWSEQTPLNPKNVTSVNLVSFGMAPGAFSYAVDEIGFY